MEEIAAANENFLFQMYWINGRDWVSAQMDRARSAGAKAVILTLDWSYSHSRDWGSPELPDGIDLKTMVKYAPSVLARPRWLGRFLKSGHLPDLTAPNMSVDGSPPPTFFGAYGQWMGSPQPTWDDLNWFVNEWGGPCIVKGVMRVDDARRARDAGFTGLSVSNHGGNNLDGTPSPLRALPAIAEAVGADIDVLLDGGIRRGSDVVKAVALGARAVMIGRTSGGLQLTVRRASKMSSMCCVWALILRFSEWAFAQSMTSIVITSSFQTASNAVSVLAEVTRGNWSHPFRPGVEWKPFGNEVVHWCICVAVSDCHPAEQHLVLGCTDKFRDCTVPT
jgi:hypothetical protein